MTKTVKQDVLVVWRQGAYADVLKKMFGEEMVATSADELIRALGKADGCAGLIVLTELDWDGHRLTEHYGVEVVKTQVRVKLKSRLPVLFVSFCSLEQILLDGRGGELLQRRLVGAVGHELAQLPSAPEHWRGRVKAMGRLTDLQFLDVVSNLCDLWGLIGEAIHQTQGKVRDELTRAGESAGEAVRGVVKAALDEIAAMLGGDAGARVGQSLLKRYDAEVAAGVLDVQSYLVTCGETFKSLVRNEAGGAEVAEPSREKLPWKVLILDDEPAWLAPIIEALDKRGIECAVASTVAEAERIIDEDVFNEITVVISDYRLHETAGGITRQQRKQGYDFLCCMTHKDRLTALIALSGLSRKFLLESFQRYNARVDVFSKNYLRTEGAVNLFADRVLDAGGETYDALCSRPSGAGWASLLPFYVAHRQSRDYKESERNIGSRARAYVLRVEEIFESRSTELLFQPSLEELEDLQSDLKKAAATDARTMRRFRNKLIARRIAVWLSMVKHFGHAKIYATLNGRLDVPGMLEEIKDGLRNEAEKKGHNWAAELEQNAGARLEERAKQLFNKLALKLSDLPDGLLAEERQWLKHEMRLGDVHDLSHLLNQSFYCVRVGLEKWAALNPKLVRRLDGSDGWQEQSPPPVTNWGDAADALQSVTEVLLTEADKKNYLSLLRHIRKNIPAYARDAEHTRDANEVAAFLERLDDLVRRAGAPHGGPACN